MCLGLPPEALNWFAQFQLQADQLLTVASHMAAANQHQTTSSQEYQVPRLPFQELDAFLKHESSLRDTGYHAFLVRFFA